jgi:hypothetical protein
MSSMVVLTVKAQGSWLEQCKDFKGGWKDAIVVLQDAIATLATIINIMRPCHRLSSACHRTYIIWNSLEHTLPMAR